MGMEGLCLILPEVNEWHLESYLSLTGKKWFYIQVGSFPEHKSEEFSTVNVFQKHRAQGKLSTVSSIEEGMQIVKQSIGLKSQFSNQLGKI